MARNREWAPLDVPTGMQLDPVIEVETPLGRGYAIIYEADEWQTWWTVVLKTGAIVTFEQKKIRVRRDYSHGMGITLEHMEMLVK